MKKNYFYIPVFFVFIYSCVSKEEKAKPIALIENSIDINKVVVSLPDAKGIDLVNANCMTCHSLRYIEMQPDMNKKGWDKIVKKMVKMYGAPISDTTIVNQIVDYLVTIKGK